MLRISDCSQYAEMGRHPSNGAMKKAIVDTAVNAIAAQVVIRKAFEVPLDPRRRKKRRMEILIRPVPRTKRISIVKMSFLWTVNKVRSTSHICTPL
ncbi:unnamed protein product [Periconia digitata]|uniref:Uncharacterized protein n=1 Tax=Periconia digitata TaxID=1303443 RepID=A0A9W4XF84_9PLEO|nr:unnamed protein product [Periconia digitata]